MAPLVNDLSDDDIRKLSGQGFSDEQIHNYMVYGDANGPQKSKPEGGFFSTDTLKGVGQAAVQGMAGVADTLRDVGGVLYPELSRGAPLFADGGPSIKDKAAREYGLPKVTATGVGGRAQDALYDASRLAAGNLILPGSAVEKAVATGLQTLGGQVTNAFGLGKVPGQIAGGLATAPVMAGGEALMGATTSERAFQSAMEDPQFASAFKYAQAKGLLDTPTAQEAIKNGKMTQEIWNSVKAGQAGVNAMVKADGTDILPSSALNMRATASQNAAAQAQMMDEKGVDLLATNITTGASPVVHTDEAGNILNVQNPFNPYTGTFTGSAQGPKSISQMVEDAKVAQNLIQESRTQLLQQADVALNAHNANASNTPISKISFQRDVEPLLGDLSKRIQDAEGYLINDSTSQGMRSAYSKIKDTFYNLGTVTKQSSSYPRGIDFEMSPSQVNELLVQMNAYRRMLGEFDAATLQGENAGNLSQVAEIKGQLDAIPQIQSALSSVLKNKIDEIAMVVPEFSGSGQALSLMNSRYGALQQFERSASNSDSFNDKGFSQVGRDSLNRAVREDDSMLPNSPSAAGLTSQAWSWLKNKLGSGPEISPEAQRLSDATAFQQSRVSDMITYGQAARGSPSPLMSRNWDVVKSDASQWGRFTNFALMATGVNVNQMPEEQQKQIYRGLLSDPRLGVEVPQNGYASALTFDGKTQVVGIDKDLALQKGSRIKDPAQRALQVGGLLEDGTLLPEPMKSPDPAPAKQVDTSLAAMKFLQAGIESDPTPPDPIITQMTDSENMLDKMNKAMQYH